MLFSESVFNRIPKYCGPAGHYEKHQMLGQGSFGATWLVEWVPDEEFAAFFGVSTTGGGGGGPGASGGGPNGTGASLSLPGGPSNTSGAGTSPRSAALSGGSQNRSVSQSRSVVDQHLNRVQSGSIAPDCIIQPPNRTGMTIDELHELFQHRRNELLAAQQNAAASGGIGSMGGGSSHALSRDSHSNSDGLALGGSLTLNPPPSRAAAAATIAGATAIPPSSPTLSAGGGSSFATVNRSSFNNGGGERGSGGLKTPLGGGMGSSGGGASSALSNFYTTAMPGAVSSLACTKSFVRLSNGREVSSDRVFVCKIESNAAYKRKNQISSQEMSEEKILSNCAHPCVVGFIDEFVDDNNHYLIMEYVDGGDLRGEIQRRLDAETLKYFSEASLLFLFTQIVMGVEYLHRHNILHRDLKTSNLLLSRKWSVRLGDFGFAKQFEMDVDNNATVTTLGTPYYMAPEVLTKAPYSDKADVWAVGVILYELVTLRRPFDADTVQDLARRIVHDEYDPVDRDNVSDELLELIDAMLQKDPAKRPSAKQVLQRPIMIASMEEFINKFTRAANASSSPLDKLWSKVLCEHRDLVLSDCLTSPKSRALQQRFRSREVSVRFSRNMSRDSTGGGSSAAGSESGAKSGRRRKKLSADNSASSFQSDEDDDDNLSNSGRRGGGRGSTSNSGHLQTGSHLSADSYSGSGVKYVSMASAGKGVTPRKN